MADIEKVIKALDCRNTYDNDYSCTECPYFQTELGNHHAYCDYHRMMNDAIELLKEQKQKIEEAYHQGYVDGYQEKTIEVAEDADL